MKGYEKMKKFNIIDVLIVVFVAAVVAVGMLAVNRFTKDEATETKTVILEITDQKEGFCSVIKEGEIVYDGTENTKLGTVTSYEIKPCEKYGTSLIDGTVKRSEVPDRYDILLYIEAPKDTDVQVGKQMWIETSMYKASGYILGVTE